MVKIHVVTREGEEQVIDADAGDPLMYPLRDHDVDVEAVCGGSCSCATCHIYVEGDWLEKLPKPDDMEQELLEALIETSPRSRLSCQLVVTDALDGLRVTVAPPEG